MTSSLVFYTRGGQKFWKRVPLFPFNLLFLRLPGELVMKLLIYSEEIFKKNNHISSMSSKEPSEANGKTA